MQVPLKSVVPPNPFHRPTGTSSSKPRASACCEIRTLWAYVGANVDSACVMVQP